VPITYDNVVMIYNVEAYGARPPTSWEALWDPRQRGKVIVPAQGGGDIQAILLTIIANRLAGNDDYKRTIEPGVRKLVALAPSVQTWEPKPDAYTLVANGTANISFGYNARAQFFQDRTAGKLGSVAPRESSITQINVIGALKNAQDMEASHAFVDYALDPRTQARFAKAMYYAPTNTKAVVDPAVRDRIPFLNPTLRDAMIPVDWMSLGAMRRDLLRPWRRQIIPASR
jgi:putative spermidine/putrescine transport system substrate-binding protein